MTLLSLFALVLPAALVAPKATKPEAQLAEQTARLEVLETECPAWGGERRGLEADRAPVAD
jgi:hypothetical protein